MTRNRIWNKITWSPHTIKDSKRIKLSKTLQPGSVQGTIDVPQVFRTWNSALLSMLWYQIVDGTHFVPDVYFMMCRGGGNRMSRGSQAPPKIHVFRVVFQDHRLGVQKRAKFGKERCVFGHNRQILERTWQAN